jgi:hypothetical protein
MTDDFWSDRFHWCALAAGFLAASEGRLTDSAYVKRFADEFYNEGAFMAEAKSGRRGSQMSFNAPLNLPMPLLGLNVVIRVVPDVFL